MLGAFLHVFAYVCVLLRSWGVFGHSWAALGAFLGRSGGCLATVVAALGRSRGTFGALLGSFWANLTENVSQE